MSRVYTSRRRRGLQYLAISGYVVFLGFPLLWLLSTALKSRDEIITGAASLIPKAPTLANFGAAIQQADLLQAGFNTFKVAASATVLVILLSLPASYALARFRTWLRPATLGWVLISQVFPTILVIIPLFLILKQFNLVDSLAGLTVVYVVYSLPFALWMLQGFVASIPRDLEEAAAVDGAGRLRVLVSIILPLLRPGLVAAALFTFISTWNEFLFALVLIQDPQKVTLSLTLARFVGSEGQVQLGTLAAGSLIATVPSLVFFLLIQRRLTSGLLTGAIKG